MMVAFLFYIPTVNGLMMANGGLNGGKTDGFATGQCMVNDG